MILLRFGLTMARKVRLTQKVDPWQEGPRARKRVA